MSGEFVKAGYLVKSPPEFKALVAQWHKRWFLLMDSKLVYPLAERYVRLEYYQSEQDAKRLADPKGVINLTSCTQVISREPIKGHRYVFDVHTEDRVYHLVAESGEDKQQWITTLNNLLFKEVQPQSGSPPRQRRWSPEQQHILRVERPSSRSQRPLSYTGQPSPSLLQRPLPPVPNGHPPQKPPKPLRQQRPLPPAPTNTPPTTIQEKSKPTSPRPPRIKKTDGKKEPPPKPPPYKKPNSLPTILTSSPVLSPPPVDITGHYDVAPGQTSVMVIPSPVTSKRILSVPQSKNSDNDDDDYSVLENANVLIVENGDMYSHLTPTGTSLPPDKPQSKGVHTVVLQNDEDYSLLQH